METQNINEIIKNSNESKVEDKSLLGSKIQLIVFKLGGEEYALPIDQIKEVVITPSISQVPKTPDYIKGVANIRGNVIAIMDLEHKFNLKGDAKEKLDTGHNYTLVIESEEYKVGVLVSEVPNTLNTTIDAIDKSSNVMQFSSLDQDCISGIVKEENRMIILIDIIKMVEKDEMNA